MNGAQLQRALTTVAGARLTPLTPLDEVLRGYPDLAQERWAAWRRKQQLDRDVPASFEQVLADVSALADPALRGHVAGLRWAPNDRVWHTGRLVPH